MKRKRSSNVNVLFGEFRTEMGAQVEIVSMVFTEIRNGGGEGGLHGFDAVRSLEQFEDFEELFRGKRFRRPNR